MSIPGPLLTYIHGPTRRGSSTTKGFLAEHSSRGPEKTTPFDTSKRKETFVPTCLSPIGTVMVIGIFWFRICFCQCNTLRTMAMADYRLSMKRETPFGTFSKTPPEEGLWWWIGMAINGWICCSCQRSGTDLNTPTTSLVTRTRFVSPLESVFGSVCFPEDTWRSEGCVIFLAVL